MAILRAGIIYWALVFALGFVLGSVRVAWGAAALGEASFILIEVPVMIAASWFAARWLVGRHGLRTIGAAGLMGAIALALLLGAELTLAMVLSGESVCAWFSGLWRMPYLLGTLGQIVFALMPMAAVSR
ncbi:hypothetical protein P8Q88_06455 [Qipengyuania sp. XHP0207]|uniref:hypothetical protein n=1 Tax=Qipengyuania sp. XHP0207 TaxID=3038078 RepID=UPI00241C2205|nr:hypothetical protein [Qipengyuania sp. XHP0207]MDG5747816.1 hypothetical protein [Qipengyuania sp. XHP0207]